MKKILVVIMALVMGPRVMHAAVPVGTDSRSRAATQVTAARGVMERLIPGVSSHFVLEFIPQEKERDRFELESKEGKIVLRGSSGVAICSAFNWYLKTYCHAHVSACGSQLRLPSPLPTVPALVTRTTPYQWRYTYNYCTFGYTMAFWGWDEWESEIDRMALDGINMPLAATGMEVIYRNVYRDMGLTDKEIAEFISGPSFLPWFLMGNLDGWGGPLSDSWYMQQETLQKKILARQRSLGIRPVMPAFGGHVPAALQTKYPEAQVTRLRSWGGFKGTYVLSPDDPLFGEIGQRFVREVTRLYGTDHLYSADTFNEMDPPSTEPSYLKGVSNAVYDSMAAGDPAAIWVMQGWLFLHGDFWSQPRIDALLSGVPDDKMLLLDLFATAKPQWQRTDAFAGKPWIWCMLNNWGGKQGMYGRMSAVAETLPETLKNRESGQLMGIGCTKEGGENNPIVYDLLHEMTWRDQPVDLANWTQQYVHRRYGKDNPSAQAAWRILSKQLYQCDDLRHGPQGSFLAMNPTFSPKGGGFARAPIFYEPAEVQKAFGLLLEAADELGAEETYCYDLVDLGRQVMSDLSQTDLHAELRRAFNKKDLARFESATEAYLAAIKDTDQLLRSHAHFQLGRWLAMPKAIPGSASETALYEQNARRLITLWGSEKSGLRGYAQRQYGGLMGDFCYARWQQFFEAAEESLRENKPFNEKHVDRVIRAYESKWVQSTNVYPADAEGDAVESARMIYKKYCEE